MDEIRELTEEEAEEIDALLWLGAPLAGIVTSGGVVIITAQPLSEEVN